MKNLFVLIFTILFAVNAFAQTDAQKQLAATEKAFAGAAAEKGIKFAFLEFLADDGIIFRPAAINGKESWRSRPDSPALLSWYPVFVDAASNGALGYTTGAGEFRPKGKDDTQIYYSEYATVWRKTADGDYKAVLDIGISHDKPTNENKNWTSPKISAEKVSDENKPPASNSMNLFFDTATTKGLSKAYKNFAAEDVRFLRDGKFPILGKQNAPSDVKKSKIKFGKSVTIQSAGDLAYAVTTYEMKDGDTTTEKGNFVQIWKLISGKWQIVLDVFSPIPLEKK